MLGPLVNPARPKVQMTGVFSLELARIYQYLFQEENVQFCIIHALDGFDEITLTGDCKMITNKGEQIIQPTHFHFPKANFDELFGGNTVHEAAEIFTRIIDGNGMVAQNNVVLANASIALQTYYPSMCLEEAIDQVTESLLGLKAKKSFNILKEVQ